MSQIKEAIEQIKIVRKMIGKMIDCPHAKNVDSCGFCKRGKLLDQALALLQEPPPASDFTKHCRSALDITADESVKTESYTDNLEAVLRIACDRLDKAEMRIAVILRNRDSIYNQKCRNYKQIKQLEANLKDLLEACEGLMKKADNGSADFDDPHPGSIYLKAKDAIAKAKEK